MFAAIILLLVTLQRLSELVIARRNTSALMAAGAVESGASHYPVMVLLHTSWLVSLWIFAIGATAHLGLLAAYLALQLVRIWILVTLGKRWTTRVINVPGEQPVTTGPFRFLRHPNYAVVALEVPLLPLVFGLGWLAALFGVLNLIMLAWRIHVEEQAWRQFASASGAR